MPLPSHLRAEMVRDLKRKQMADEEEEQIVAEQAENATEDVPRPVKKKREKPQKLLELELKQWLTQACTSTKDTNERNVTRAEYYKKMLLDLQTPASEEEDSFKKQKEDMASLLTTTVTTASDKLTEILAAVNEEVNVPVATEEKKNALQAGVKDTLRVAPSTYNN